MLTCASNSVQPRARTFRPTQPGHGLEGWPLRWARPEPGGENYVATLRRRIAAGRQGLRSPPGHNASPVVAPLPNGRENLLMTPVIKTLIVLVALCALAAPAAQAGYRDVVKDCAPAGPLD